MTWFSQVENKQKNQQRKSGFESHSSGTKINHTRWVPGGSTHSPMHTAAHTATHSRAHSLAPRSSCLWPGTRSGVYARIYTYVYTSRIYITRRRLQASREHHVKLVSWCVSAAACPSSNEMIQCKIYARVALLLRLQVCAREGVDGLSECPRPLIDNILTDHSESQEGYGA